jgi:hypothetical protein
MPDPDAPRIVPDRIRLFLDQQNLDRRRTRRMETVERVLREPLKVWKIKRKPLY